LAVNNIFSVNSYNSTDCGLDDYVEAVRIDTLTLLAGIQHSITFRAPLGTKAIEPIDVGNRLDLQFGERLSKYMSCGSN
jgi:hypothetical protein